MTTPGLFSLAPRNEETCAKRCSERRRNACCCCCALHRGHAEATGGRKRRCNVRSRRCRRHPTVRSASCGASTPATSRAAGCGPSMRYSTRWPRTRATSLRPTTRLPASPATTTAVTATSENVFWRNTTMRRCSTTARRIRGRWSAFCASKTRAGSWETPICWGSSIPKSPKSTAISTTTPPCCSMPGRPTTTTCVPTNPTTAAMPCSTLPMPIPTWSTTTVPASTTSGRCS